MNVAFSISRAAVVALAAMIEIEVADHHVIGENGEIKACFLPAAKNRRRLAAADEPGHITRYFAGLACKTAKCAAQCVHNSTPGLKYDVRGKVFILQGRSISAQSFGYGLHGSVTISVGRRTVLAPASCKTPRTRSMDNTTLGGLHHEYSLAPDVA